MIWFKETTCSLKWDKSGLTYVFMHQNHFAFYAGVNYSIFISFPRERENKEGYCIMYNNFSNSNKTK